MSSQIEALMKACSAGGGQTFCIIHIPENTRGIPRPLLVKGSNKNRQVVQKPRQRKYSETRQENEEEERPQLAARSRSPKRESKETSRSAEEEDSYEDRRPENRSYYKTKICNRWTRNDCPYSLSQCKFAHGESDLREAPERLICIPFKNGHCEYGDRCRNIH
jgi:hypothetical protein